MAGFGKAFGDIPRLPNEGSTHQTPASLYIDVHYSTLEIAERWSWERYVRLCNILKMTPWELASLVGMRHKDADFFEQNNRLPDAGRRSISLLLTIVEAHFLSELHHDVIKNPFPDLNKVT